MDASLCNYRSKRCFNARSLKNDGSLHRFCAVHRARANDAQRRWHARRRRLGSLDSDSSDESDATTWKRRRVDASQNEPTTTPITTLDTWVPLASKTVCAVDFDLTPFVPSVHGPNKGFAADELVSLEAFMSELDAFSLDDVRFSPDAALAQAMEDGFVVHL